MGKSRLAPIKPVTIPRLELSAAVMATRLDRISQNELTLPITESFFWTDSTCIFRYNENKDKRFQTFVANRIATIHDASSPSQWKYTNTQDNLADDSSRGVPADLLQLWIHDPNFLPSPPEMWPRSMMSAIPEDDPENKSEKAIYTVNAPTRDPVTEIIQRFSSWSKLNQQLEPRQDPWFLAAAQCQENLQPSNWFPSRWSVEVVHPHHTQDVNQGTSTRWRKSQYFDVWSWGHSKLQNNHQTLWWSTGSGTPDAQSPVTVVGRTCCSTWNLF